MADWWYSGSRSDLWAEYKYLPKLPARAATVITPDLSEQQKDWLRGRHTEGRNVCVIVGCPEGAVVYQNLTWERGMTTEDFRNCLISRQDLARWIVSQTLEG